MLILAALSVAAAFLSDQAPPSATAPPPSAIQSHLAKLKCEKVVVLGSRMPVRVCRTPEQIAADASQTAATMRDIRGDLQLQPPPDVKR